jgi:hypothetical protein
MEISLKHFCSKFFVSNLYDNDNKWFYKFLFQSYEKIVIAQCASCIFHERFGLEVHKKIYEIHYEVVYWQDAQNWRHYFMNDGGIPQIYEFMFQFCFFSIIECVCDKCLPWTLMWQFATIVCQCFT